MNVVQKEDGKSTLLQGAGTPDYQNASHEKPNLQINRRRMLAQAGILGASGALTTLAIPAGATSEHDTEGLLAGLWHGVISSPGTRPCPLSLLSAQ
jgi:hypothetical protein